MASLFICYGINASAQTQDRLRKDKITKIIHHKSFHYNNFKLSFKERKASLEEEVKIGNINKQENGEEVRYTDSTGAIIAEGNKAFFDFINSDAAIEYDIYEKSMPLHVQEKGRAHRLDHYCASSDDQDYRLESSFLKNSEINLRMEFDRKTENVISTDIFRYDSNGQATTRITYIFPDNREFEDSYPYTKETFKGGYISVVENYDIEGHLARKCDRKGYDVLEATHYDLSGNISHVTKFNQPKTILKAHLRDITD